MENAWTVARQVVANGRGCVWLLVDNRHPHGSGAEPTVVCKFDDPHEAKAFAATLNGADPVYRAELAKLHRDEAF